MIIKENAWLQGAECVTVFRAKGKRGARHCKREHPSDSKKEPQLTQKNLQIKMGKLLTLRCIKSQPFGTQFYSTAQVKQRNFHLQVSSEEHGYNGKRCIYAKHTPPSF